MGLAQNLSPADVKQILDFWGHRCFATGLTCTPLSLVPVVDSPSSWRDFVPLMRSVAKRSNHRLPPEPTLIQRWNARLGPEEEHKTGSLGLSESLLDD